MTDTERARAAEVLVVEDDPLALKLVQRILSTEGYRVTGFERGEEALERIRQNAPDAVVSDLNLPGIDGMEILERVGELAPEVPVVMLTGSGNIKIAVDAIRKGAYEFLTKPIEHDLLVLTMRRALEKRRLVGEVRRLSRGRGRPTLETLMGPSAKVRAIQEAVRQVAPSSMSVLVQGETGTGKELVARAIHDESGRSGKPFIAIDCGAIPETLAESELFGHEPGAFTGATKAKAGQFRLAEGGTVFLDEIGNLPGLLQPKLLRVLQERQVQPVGGAKAVPVDVRFVAATNEGLESAIREKRFRQDLFYRLAEFTIGLPTLRDRSEDVLPLARRFLEEAGIEFRKPTRVLSDEAARVLIESRWPGNVRELRSVIRRAVLLADDAIQPEHLRGAMGTPAASVETRAPETAPILDGSLREIGERAVAAAEREAIRRALDACGGNKAAAARQLQTDYKTLHVKIKRYGL